jgi:hypothetical protein
VSGADSGLNATLGLLLFPQVQLKIGAYFVLK